MNRGNIITIENKNYFILFTGETIFLAKELFKGEEMDGGTITAIAENTKNGFEALCKALEFMSEAGEAYRKYMGYEKKETLKADYIKKVLLPYEIADLKNIIAETVVKCFKKEIEEPEQEIDLGLLELQKKTR